MVEYRPFVRRLNNLAEIACDALTPEESPFSVKIYLQVFDDEVKNSNYFRQNLVTILLPQMLVLHKLSSNKYRLLGHGRNFQKNIGPVEDSMADSILQGNMFMLADTS